MIITDTTMTENEKKTMTSLTVDMDGVDYVMEGGGGIKPGVPIPPDTVDSQAIIDGAVPMEDLNTEVKDTMLTGDDRVTQEDLDNFEV
jgi:hypothetical protein